MFEEDVQYAIEQQSWSTPAPGTQLENEACAAEGWLTSASSHPPREPARGRRHTHEHRHQYDTRIFDEKVAGVASLVPRSFRGPRTRGAPPARASGLKSGAS